MSKLSQLIQELCLDGVEYKSLNEIACYSNKRIEATDVSANNYVGVDNLLPNKKGKTISAHTPSTGYLIRYEKDDILIGNIRPYLKKIWLADIDGGTNGDVLVIHISSKELIVPRFLYYVLSSDNFFLYDMQNAKGAKMPRGSKSAIMKYSVPLPPFKVQQEIIRILDSFAEFITALTAELTARKQQYEHYCGELLQFKNINIKTQRLENCCTLEKGITPIQKAIPGKYPLVVTTNERKTSASYQFDGPTVCIPLISSRGHGVASLNQIYYQEGKFALGNILCAVKPFSENYLSAKFLYYYLNYKKDVLLVPLMRGGANVAMTVDSLKGVKIAIPPLDIQQEIVHDLDCFNTFCNDMSSGLPAEIEARQKQYEYYRDKLLTFKERMA